MPPIAYRPWTRWWWPGGDVEAAELRREVQLLAETLFGGAEIQPFVAGIDPATLNDPASAIYDYGSPAYYEKLAAVLQEAGKHDLRIDLTVGSGWPPGGPSVPLHGNPDTLLYGETTVTRAAAMPVPPPIMPFAYALYSPGGVLRLLDHVAWVKTLAYHPEEARLIAVVAAKITDDRRSPDPSVLTDTTDLDLDSAVDITDCVHDGYVTWTPPSAGAWRVVALYTMPSGSRTLIAAVQGDSYAVDPFDSAAISSFYEDWLGSRPEILCHAGQTLRAVFSDSFEYFPQRHFADDLLETFRACRGYDITSYLPAVLQPARDQTFFFFSGLRAAPDFSFGPVSERLIHDYDLTISDLFFKHWYPASRQWTEQHNLLFRQQGYNPPLDVIKAAGAAHLPETEGGNERLLKRVASGAHLYGRPLISAESFVFYPQGGYGLTPQDYKAGVDLLMTAGVNFILYHGTPYRWPQPGYGETGWAPFISPYGSNITSNVSEADPFWKFQADLNLYAARVQYLLQQGAPDADLLVYLPMFADPADARFAPALQALEAHGRAWEWVNDELLAQAEWTGAGLRVGEMDFQSVLLPDVESLPPATAARLADMAQAGAPVIVIGNLPARQPGFLNYAENDGLVARHMQTVISQAQCAHVAEAGDLAACLRALPAALLAYEENDALRLIRRKLPDGGYVAFVRNTSRQPTRFALTVDPALRACTWLDAADGKVYRAEAVDGRLAGRLPGLGAMALLCSPDDVFAAEELAEGNPVGEAKVVASFALSEWTLTVTGEDVPSGAVTMAADALGDWRLREALTYVSSPGVYATVATLDEVVAGRRYILDLGEVFAAAEVSVNGQAAGRALFSPWQVDITACLHAGDNAIRVEVTPALHNRLLGKALRGDAEYVQFLGDRSGPRRPLPSGLVGPVTLQTVEAAA